MRDTYLRRCLTSIRALSPSVPVLVADTGKASKKRRELTERHRATLLQLPFDAGVAFARNRLVDAVESPVMLLVEDDMEITPNSRVEDMRTLLEMGDIVCGAPLLASGKVHHYEGHLHRKDGTLVMDPLSRDYDTHEGVRFARCDIGMNILMGRTETFRDHPWDERYKIVYEHLDYFLGAQDKGLRVVYAPDSLFPHKRVPVNTGDRYRAFRDRTPESRPLFYDKWGFSAVQEMSGWWNYPDGTRRHNPEPAPAPGGTD